MTAFKKFTAISLAILSIVPTTTLVSAGKRKKTSNTQRILSELKMSERQLMLKKIRKNPILKREIKLHDAFKMNDVQLQQKINEIIEKNCIKQQFQSSSEEEEFINSNLDDSIGQFLSRYLDDQGNNIDDYMINDVIDQVNIALEQETRDERNGINISGNGGSITIVGDTHGDFNSTQHIIRYFLKQLKSNPNEKILFLGNYVDKGYDNVKNFIVICTLKATFPNNVYMLRGNHEDLGLNTWCGLFAEMKNNYSHCGNVNELSAQFKSVYDNLPLAAILDEKIFCVHGGIPQPVDNPDYYESDQYVEDLLWSDPDIFNQVHGPNTFEKNENRGQTGNLFTNEALEDFLVSHNYTAVIRSNQALQKAQSDLIKTNFAGRLVSIFSAKDHPSCMPIPDEQSNEIYNPPTDGFVSVVHTSLELISSIETRLIDDLEID